jgi:DNA-binding transcriptional regulator YiaG
MTAAEFLAARKSFGLTQPEWGRMLGLSKPQIQKIESGKHPASDAAKRLINAYREGYRPADWPEKPHKAEQEPK